MINLQRILIVALTAALFLSMVDSFKSDEIIRDKSRVIYDLTLDNNDIENQNALLKQALLEK